MDQRGHWRSLGSAPNSLAVSCGNAAEQASVGTSVSQVGHSRDVRRSAEALNHGASETIEVKAIEMSDLDEGCGG